MSRLQLEIEGMSCNHCIAAVTEALSELPSVNVETVRIGAADVSYQPEAISPDQILLAVEDAGYAAQAKG